MSNTITAKVAQEIISHEAILLEAYKDSVGIWTWSVGITNSSGHIVDPKYIDKPQSLERCIEVFEWVLREKYLPAVDQVFQGFNLSEEQFAAALSFHYNTGSIGKATWVKQWKEGKTEEAYKSIMDWNKPPEIIPRREKERELFFNGVWSSNGKATVYPVRKPSYSPDWSNGKTVNIATTLNGLFS